MKALITGGGGQVASDLQALLGDSARSFTRTQLDITDPDALARAFDDVQPDVVFNCAAFHNVDVCETESTRSWQVNVEAVRELVQRSPRLVHFSTNYVFDGTAGEPYAETDATSPRSIYAITKLAGEQAALAYGSGALIVRTGGLYGLHGSASKGGNFVQRMIARAGKDGALRMVSDQIVQPTFTADLAQGVIDAVDAGAEGVVHVTSSGSCSWFQFTEAITERAGIDVPIEPVTTTVAPGAVQRPLNGVLARPVADAQGVPVLRRWDDALTDYMERAGLLAGVAHTH